MSEHFMAQLEKWRAEGNHAGIAAAIRALQPAERGYGLTMELVWALVRQNDFDGAISELVALKEEGEHDPQWHYLLGCSYFALEQYDLAMKAFEAVLLLDGADERAWRLLGHCCRQVGEESPLYQQLGRPFAGTLSPLVYQPEEHACVQNHIRRYFGNAGMIIRAEASEEIALDIWVINPSPQRPFYTLVTVGMGAYRMHVPEVLQSASLERAELLICLPMDWQVTNPLDKWQWPIGWLKTLAALPQREGGWLAWGHTVPNEGPIAEGTALAGMILSSPCALPKEAGVCQIAEEDAVNFYQLIPLYEEEIRFKRERGAEALFSRFEGAEQVDHVVDLYRPNTCAVLINKEWAIPAAALKPLLTDWQEPDGALATDRIMLDGAAVGYMYREAPEEDAADSGWRFLAGDESAEYIADYDHFGIYRLNTICNYDPEVLALLSAPYGTAYYRDDAGVFRQEIKRLPTLAARAEAYWQWFVGHEAQIAALADGHDGAGWRSLFSEGALLIAEELPCLLGAGRVVIWPAEMCPWRYYLLPYLRSRAPKELRADWQFYVGRPAAMDAGAVVTVREQTFRLLDVLAGINREETAEMFSLRLYHPAWSEMTEMAIYEAIAQLVDAALGEEWAYLYVGDFVIAEQPDGDMFALSALKQRMQEEMTAQGRPIFTRAVEYPRVYERLPEKRNAMRYDVYWGETCYPELVNGYYSAFDDNAEELAAYGAQAVYLFFAHGGLLLTEALREFLQEMRARLEQLLGGDGLVLGYALGEDCGYLDLLLFDMPAFLDALEDVLSVYPYQFFLAELKANGRIAKL